MKLDKKLAVKTIPFAVLGGLATNVAEAYRIADEEGFARKLLGTGDMLAVAFENPLPSLHPQDFIIGIFCGLTIKFIVYAKGKNKKKFRHNEEYGSARWGNAKDIANYSDKIFANNVILSQSEFLTMNGRPKKVKFARNKNILVIGGSGSGKTRFFVKPNLLQMHSSYVVTDPKGTVLLEVGKALQKGVPKRDKKGNPVRDKNGKIIYEGGYDIKVLNTINFSKSMKYNPFAYIRSEKDILKLANTIIANTKGDGDKSGEDFWVKAERLYYTALIGYIYYECEPHDRNMNSLINLINQSETREEDEEFMNAVDLMFESVEKGERLTSEEEMIDDEGDPVYGEDGNPIYEKILLYGENGEPLWLFRPRPDHFAVRQYKKFKLAAGKTTKSILISCGARLAPFDIQELRELTEYDELDLESLGTKKTALFVIISDTDDTFNFLVAIMYTQLFNILCDLADDKYGGRLPVHVRCILDEFANIGSIPKFEKLIATIRSREISACVILQAQSQLKAIYKDNADTIIGNCDSTLFLGGKEESTLKGLSEVLGKETIELYNTSRSRGGQESYGMNYQKLGRELMAKDEIAVMDGDKCIVQIRGTRPFFSNKYDLMKHPNITFTADANPKHTFDVDKHLRSRRKGIKDDMKVDENTVVEEIHDMRETA